MGGDKHTPSPWFVGGVRQKIDGQQALGVFRYDEEAKRDLNIASVWYDPKDGAGTLDARLIAAAPELLEAAHELFAFVAIMVGRGPDATIPETIATPLGAHVKIGKIMRDAQAALAKAGASHV
ncbi:MAG: hypothetical protein ABFD96_10665 [Armatimonadia bacterium]